VNPALPARPRVVVLAKLPQPGLAKTRLMPALGAAGAARLAERLLRHAVAEACRAGIGPVELCLAPKADDPLALALQEQHGLMLATQADGDLGARLDAAARRALAADGAVLLMGTDAPALDAARLRQAAAALGRCDAVLVPAADGGYALLGLKPGERLLPKHFFAQMPWSTAAVAALTRERLQAAGLSLAELPAVHDIDTPDDLCHLPAGWPDPSA
jgi:uncharacterized protein